MTSSQYPQKRKRIEETHETMDFDLEEASDTVWQQQPRAIATNCTNELIKFCQKHGLTMIYLPPRYQSRNHPQMELKITGKFIVRNLQIISSGPCASTKHAKRECARKALSWLQENIPYNWPTMKSDVPLWRMYDRLVEVGVDRKVIGEFLFWHRAQEDAEFAKRGILLSKTTEPPTLANTNADLARNKSTDARGEFLSMVEQMPDQALKEMMSLAGSMDKLGLT